MKRPTMLIAAAALTVAMVALPAAAANAVLVTLGANTTDCTYYSSSYKLGASAYSTGQTVFTFYKTPSDNRTFSAAGTSTRTWKTRMSPFTSVSYTNISATSITSYNYTCQ